MPFPLMAAYGASAGLQILSGFLGSLGADSAAGAAESRGRMAMMEAEAEARRYREQGTRFKAHQKLAYLKNGVQISGSPLDALNDTELTIRENMAAIRAAGASRASEYNSAAAQARLGGRVSFLQGILGGASTAVQGYGRQSEINDLGRPRNNTPLSNPGYTANGTGMWR